MKATKQPKTVQIKLLVPYGVIIALAIFFAGNVNGWTMRGAQEGQVKAEANSLVSSLKVKR